MQSPKLISIRQQLSKGKSDPNCESCEKQEKNFNYATLRNHYNTNYPLENDNFSLSFLDIRWNNKCNLGCMYCNQRSSSVWEERINQTKSTSFKSYQDDLLAWIVKQSDSINELMLVGGEPMLMKQNYQLFASLPNTTQISIITNLAYDLPRLPCVQDLLKRPVDKIIWNVSLENTKEKFEYIRNGGSWQQIVDNLTFLKHHWPDTVSLNMVYGIFSAFDLSDTLQDFGNLGVRKINLLPVTGMEEMSVFSMPKAVRQKAVQILKDVSDWHHASLGEDAVLYPLRGINQILDGLKKDQPGTVSLSQIKNKIIWMDSWQTSKKFIDLWPNVIDLLETHLVE